MRHMNKLEVIAWSVDDAIRIEEGGADRIELVVDLDKGGLTPPLDLVKKVVEKVNIPVRVMIRDKWDSFVYDDEMMQGHLIYIELLQHINPEGIVFGSLTDKDLIDFDQLNEVIKVKGNMKLTFHRAFDELRSKVALKQFRHLAKYDVDTLLTSGLENSAWEGRKLIKKLIDKEKINILPGKSIDINNYQGIIKETGATYIHVGYAVRDKDGRIDINLIKKMKEGMNNND